MFRSSLHHYTCLQIRYEANSKIWRKFLESSSWVEFLWFIGYSKWADILRALESDFLESNTIWPIPYPTFSKLGENFGKKGVIFDEIFDFLGIRIWLFEILNYLNRSASNFLISDDICIQLFAIRSFTNDDIMRNSSWYDDLFISLGGKGSGSIVFSML